MRSSPTSQEIAVPRLGEGLRQRQETFGNLGACIESLKTHLSITPGFSPVTPSREMVRNRFNGFSVGWSGNLIRLSN